LGRDGITFHEAIVPAVTGTANHALCVRQFVV
jgi:hypothetical protein